MNDVEFENEINQIFENYLKNKRVFIRNKSEDKLLTSSDINYDKLFFDSSMNIYKVSNGTLVKVVDDNFDTIVK